jgi:EthD domain
MMKMMILAGRRAGMTPGEFRRYVTQVHGPLVASVPEVAAAIRRYHYNFPLFGARDEAFDHVTASHLDIVTQGWFDSRAAQLANMAEPRYLQIIRPDEGRFADESRAVMHYTREVPILEGAVTATKIFYFRRRRAGLSRTEFQNLWQTQFAAALGSNAAFGKVVSRYVQNHALSEAEHPHGSQQKYFDVIDELCLRTPLSLALLRNDLAAMQRSRELETLWLDVSLTRALVTETIINIP